MTDHSKGSAGGSDADLTPPGVGSAGLERGFDDLVGALPLGVYRTKPDGELLLANRALATIYGYESVEEMKAASQHGEVFGREQDGANAAVELSTRPNDLAIGTRGSPRGLLSSLQPHLELRGEASDGVVYRRLDQGRAAHFGRVHRAGIRTPGNSCCLLHCRRVHRHAPHSTDPCARQTG